MKDAKDYFPCALCGVHTYKDEVLVFVLEGKDKDQLSEADASWFGKPSARYVCHACAWEVFSTYKRIKTWD